MPNDPRIYQIFILSLLLLYGLGFAGFDTTPAHAAIALSSVLIFQCLASWWVTIPYDPRSALISGLSLSLLLRTDSPEIIVLAAGIAILSKFILRIDNAHIFNPTNLALTSVVLLTGEAWISPGQWGSATWLALLIGCGGMVVITRARRWLTPLLFLGSYCAIIFGRALWLGDPLAIPLHQLQSGALLLFTFFMISDPKTMPRHRNGQIVFAVGTAIIACIMQFAFYIPLSIVYALTLTCLLTPLVNRLWQAERYIWPPHLSKETMHVHS